MSKDSTDLLKIARRFLETSTNNVRFVRSSTKGVSLRTQVAKLSNTSTDLPDWSRSA